MSDASRIPLESNGNGRPKFLYYSFVHSGQRVTSSLKHGQEKFFLYVAELEEKSR